ncbi:hypothetical protein JTB14_029727 [Gonioctena quinquepunctata]|nr:hypothetical protein JTB14_029727 [Gonioctena quinquepunctata]
MRLNMSKIIFFIFGIFYVDCWNFDVRNVKEIHVSEGSNVRRTYFGYSLLLQRGSSPIVIVGSPKDDAHSGGAIYACNALDAGECHKYNITTNNLGSFNGNFLGIAIDGDENKGEPFIVCAPREVTKTGTFRSRFYNYYMRGRCFYHENSALLESSNIELRPLDHIPMLSLFNGAAYYDSAFGQVGMDVHYIKVSFLTQ